MADEWSLFASVRHALWHGARALELTSGDEVLVPAYHHGAEVEALLRAGLVPRFYDGGPALEPDPDELDDLLGPKVRALLLIHYLGFPQDAPRLRAWCDERKLVLLEDAAQAWLASVDEGPVGSFGDLAVFSLRATLGLPDGAALLTRATVSAPEAPSRRDLALVAHRHGAWATQHSGLLATLAGRLHRSGAKAAAAGFDLGDPATPASSTTRHLLPRLAEAQIASRRRAHYAVLLEELAGRVAAPFDNVPAGASPLALPIEDADRDALRSRLAAHGIVAPAFWPTPHPSLGSSVAADLARRRERTLVLPVHQELAPRDLERIVAAVRGPGRRTDALRVELVESLDELREDWTNLAERADNVFATWEWASTWWRHFGAGRPLSIVACRSTDGRLRAILPLYQYAKLPVRIVRYIGHGAGDQLGPVCAPDDRLVTARAIRRALRMLKADLLLADHHAGDESWSALCGGRVLTTVGAPVLHCEGRDWEQVLAGFSSNLRQQVRRLERKLQREHGLVYRQGGVDGDLAQDMETLFALHSDRWEAGDTQFTGAHLAFHRDFAAVAHERGWLRLWFMEADGRTVAAWHGFRFRDVEYYYQAGRDPNWKGPAIGFALLAHSIRAGVEDGVREYRFLRGEQPFKYRFANGDPGVESFGVPCGHRARLALAASTTLPAPLAARARRRVTA